MTTTAERYHSVSSQLFAQAHVELESGDLVQASEKFWGATAQALKAIAHQRGWEHKSHASFYRIIRQLADETGDRQIRTLFQAADSLHANFYEHWMDQQQILELSDQVAQLIDRLAEIDAT